ncbi:beta strand repeat-containing protein [Helicobacter ibis]|uniref:Autotransporter domain-containing protein n=2 Tax=Helicobacter TaxID=209 RepID=A0ABT4VFF2_9HELI|nr:hypothetical protein [Helicobacter ibis]MDA3969452.1 hypothetical protein [Helicobacter ibis]
MKKKTNKKFTASKKSLVLSLACVSVLATVANAEISGLDQSGADKSSVKGDQNLVINEQISGSILDINGFSGGKNITINSGVTIGSITDSVNPSNGDIGKAHSGGFSGTFLNQGTITGGVEIKNFIVSGGETATFKNDGSMGYLHFDKIGVNPTNSGANAVITNNGTIEGDFSVKLVDVSTSKKASGANVSITNVGQIGGNIVLDKVNVAIVNGSGDATFNLNNEAGATVKGSINIDKLVVSNVSGGGDFGKITANITNAGTIGNGMNIGSIDFKGNGVSGGSINIANSGTIKGYMTLGTVDIISQSGSHTLDISNSGLLDGLKLNGNITLAAGENKVSKGSSNLKISNSGTLGTFEIANGVNINVSSGSAVISNTGSITDWINNGNINAEGSSGSITISNSGTIENLINNGKVLNKTGFENSGNITNFTNSKTGFISKITNADASANAYIGTLNNAGKITTIVNGGTSSYGTINTLVNTGSIGSGANTAAGVANNAGSVINTIANYGNIIDGANFSGANAAIYNLGSIGTIINSNKFITESPDGSGSTTTSTAGKIGHIVASGASGAGTISLIDNQQGASITGIFNNATSISNIQNAGNIGSIKLNGGDKATDNSATIGTITNAIDGVIGSIALNSSGASATIDTINNAGVIGNKNATNSTQDAISFKSGGGNIATLNNTGSINGNINLTDVSGNGIGTLNNSGTITGKITLNGGKLDASSVATINTLTNYETGSIGEILVGSNSGGHIGTLNNYGTITNGITIANGSGSIVNLNNYSTLGNVDTGKVGLTNNNTIDNLRNYETGSIVYAGTGTIDKLLDNKGTIALAKGTSNAINLADGARVTNTGKIIGSQDGVSIFSTMGAISINNTGSVDVRNYKQSQIHLSGAGASANIEAWKLTLNESTSTFNNTPGYTYRVSDERYLSGTFIPAEVTPPTDGSGGDTGSGADVATPKGKWVFTTIGSGANTDSNKMNANSHIYVSKDENGKFENVNFLDKSIVLDLSTQGFEIGQVYNMDNLVYGVDNNGLLTGIGSAEWTIKDNGSGNGTLVYELDSGASSVNGGRGLTSANLAIQDDLYTISDTFIDTITSEKGDGKRVRGFSVGVDVANGAGAILAQGLTNVSARRSLFIDSITTTAIQATVDQTNRMQQVSYNDSDVNFESLAKYAQISTDAYSATTNRDTYFYAIPYYTADSMDLQGGFENLEGNTYGLIAGAQKNLYDAGIVGIFFGFESGSYDTSARYTSYKQDDLTFYGGLNYYKVLGGTESREYYVKAIAKAALISSDVSRSTTAGSGTGDASVDSANFGAGVDLGINFYLTDAHVISPEIGISYDRLNTDSFVIGNQYYEESDANLLQGKIGFNWLAQWSPVFSTNFGAGIKNNFTGDIDTAVRIDNNHISQTVDLPSTYQYVQGGLSYMITNNIEVSLNYNGNYSSDTSSHSGLLRLGMWW